MQIIVQTDDDIYEISLSENIDGNYPIYYHNQTIAVVYAYKNSWILKTIEGYALNTRRIEKVLDKDEIISIHDHAHIKALLFIKMLVNVKTFKHFTFDDTIHIGRDKSNEIHYDNRYVSNYHARLIMEDGNFILEDLNSSNHVYVNRKRFSYGLVHAGDIIDIMELQIIIGIDFISVSLPIQGISIDESSLKTYERTFESKQQETLSNQIYPCFHPSLIYEPLHCQIADLPITEPEKELPLLMKLGPSVMMGIVSISNLSFMLQNRTTEGTPYITWIMMFSMLAGTILFPLWIHFYQKKKNKAKQRQALIEYESYLIDITNKIKEDMVKERNILLNNFPSLDLLVHDESFWFVTNKEKNFLKLRFAIGERKSAIVLDGAIEQITFPLTIHAPITIDLINDYLIAVQGSKDRLIAMLEYLITRLSVEYSIKDIQMVYMGRPINDSLRWIPHFRYKDLSCFSKDKNSTFELCDIFMNELKNEKIKKPCIVLYYPIEDEIEHPFIKYIERNDYCGITLIRFSTHVSPYTQFLINLDKQEYTGKHALPLPFQTDSYTFSMDLLKKICSLSTNTEEKKDFDEQGISILSLFSIRYVEELNIWKRWESHKSAETLKVPIGKVNENQILYLDIHEKFDGPHGIMAGTTGSGKSECLLTYLLSLSIQYHPYDVSYMIIDYKGGGLAKSLECMPHCVGVITNLDGSILHRSLQALQGEIRKRQEILKITAIKYQIANITLNDYQILYYEHKVSEPLSHLLIVCDEFAELKMQQPIFLDEIISMARIGRSLGIHLLLSTQKPSGIINDQIWSNSHFHFCMKVADKMDSIDVIKKPDAAYLKKTGELFLQVGYDEIFIKGRSAYTQERYAPELRHYSNEKITVVSHMRKTEQEVCIKEIMPQPEHPITQMQVLIQHILECAKKENIKAKQLWIEPLSEIKKVDSLVELYGVKDGCLLIGEKDVPFHQCYEGFYISLLENNIVYGNRDLNKFVKVLLLASSQQEQLSIFVIDMVNTKKHGLFAYANNDIKIIDGNHTQEVQNIMQEFQRILEQQKERKGSFKVLIIIHGYYAFDELYPQLLHTLSFLLREGVNNHMNFIFTVNHENEISYRLNSCFSKSYVLDMNNVEELYSILHCKNLSCHFQSAHGYVMEEKLYEFQLADSNL